MTCACPVCEKLISSTEVKAVDQRFVDQICYLQVKCVNCGYSDDLSSLDSHNCYNNQDADLEQSSNSQMLNSTPHPKDKFGLVNCKHTR